MDYMDKFCQIFNIPSEELTKSFSIWRFNVLHVRGVESLTSKDVYNYFKQKPHSIEWLSNISCNVTFETINTTIEALLMIAKGIVIHKNDYKFTNFDNLNSQTNSLLIDLPISTSDKLTIPVPPNYRYIIGYQHANAKSIIIRFATIYDRKVDKLLDMDQDVNKNKIVIQSLPSLSSKRMEVDEGMDNLLIKRDKLRRKPLTLQRMRMRADEEEERIKNLRNQQPKRRFLQSRISYSNNGRHIWRRRVNDGIKRNFNRRNLGKDLRLALKESLLRVQVTYDDDILI